MKQLSKSTVTRNVTTIKRPRLNRLGRNCVYGVLVVALLSVASFRVVDAQKRLTEDAKHQLAPSEIAQEIKAKPHHVTECHECLRAIGGKTRAVLDEGAPRLVDRILEHKLGGHGTYKALPKVGK